MFRCPFCVLHRLSIKQYSWAKQTTLYCACSTMMCLPNTETSRKKSKVLKSFFVLLCFFPTECSFQPTWVFWILFSKICKITWSTCTHRQQCIARFPHPELTGPKSPVVITLTTAKNVIQHHYKKYQNILLMCVTPWTPHTHTPCENRAN